MGPIIFFGGSPPNGNIKKSLKGALKSPIIYKPGNTSKENTNNSKDSESLTKKTIKLGVSFGILKPLKWLANSIALAGIFLFTTNGNIAVNRALQVAGLVPKPTNLRKDDQKSDINKFDGFFSRQEQFRHFLNLLEKLNIDPEIFDLNKDGVIFNKKEDRQKARELLSTRLRHERDASIQSDIQSAINMINDLDILDQLLFGVNGLNPDRYYQGNVPNCQILAAIKELSLTEENIQVLKNLIEVSSYNLDSNNFYIDTILHIDNRKIPIPFTKLKERMSPRDFCPTYSTDSSLAFPILAYAVEEAGNKYDSIPHILQSTSPILLTGKDYVTIATWSLDDKTLKDCISLAPNTPITVLSFLDPRDLTFENIIRELDGKFNKESIPVSQEKEEQFIESMKQKTIEISGSITNTGATKNELISMKEMFPENILRNTSKGGLFPQNTESSSTQKIVSNHQYAIKSFRQIGDKTEIILTDSHGVEYEPLDLESFRKNIFVIVLPKEDIPVINLNNVTANTLIWLMLLLARKGINGLNRRIYPQYKSYFEMGFEYLRGKQSKNTNLVSIQQEPQ